MTAPQLPGMWPEPVTVRLDGETYTIPARPAVDWVRTLVSNDPLGIFPGLLDDDERHADVVEALAEDEEYAAKVRTVARSALTAVAGRPWWQADKLVQFAAINWAGILGQLALHGVDVGSLSLPAFLNAVYAWHVERLDEKGRDRFDRELADAPPGVVADEPDDGGASFMAALGAMGSG